MPFPIQVVARETGLTVHVLRIWERRYGAVVPERTATQRRVYAESDVRRLRLLRQATSLGHPIGTIANLTARQLEALVRATTASSQRTAPPAKRTARSGPNAATLLEECLEAIRGFDSAALSAVLERAAVRLGHTALLRTVIAELAQRLGDFWSDGTLRTSHEHFATAVIRGFLLNPSRQYASRADAPALVVATPQGQLHELGAVMAAALAAEQGWRVVYLGPSLPAAEIADVAAQHHARAVALSVVYPEIDANVERELRELRRFLPKGVAILVGGRGAARHRAAIRAAKAVPVNDLARLQVELEKIQARRP